MGPAPPEPTPDGSGGGQQYFAASPSSRSRPGRVRVSLRGLQFELETDRGTFSPDRLDPGTRFLLEQAPPPPEHGRFLDLGCGYGPIACVLATLAPAAEVVAVDVNERSRRLCRQNADRLGLGNVVVAAPDDVAGPFDLVWSNPPIRIGKAALHDVLARWLGQMAPEGEAVLVVNRHLGADSLQRWLTDQGMPTDRLASKKGYRLFRTTRPA